jgi:hypothetical protein
LYFLKNIVLRPEGPENSGKREKIEARHENSWGHIWREFLNLRCQVEG